MVRKAVAWLSLVGPLYLGLVLLAPWIAEGAHDFRVPGADAYGLAQALSFPFLLAYVLGALYVLWLVISLVRRVRRGRLLVPAVGVVLSVLCLALTQNLPTGQHVETAAENTARTIEVRSWNMHSWVTPGVMRDLTDGNPGVVVMPEADIASVQDKLQSIGRENAYQTFQSRRAPGKAPTTVLISHDLGDYHVVSKVQGTSGTVTLEPVDPASHEPRVVAVHTASPRPQRMDAWRKDVRDVIDGVCGPSDRAVIAAGDFNATPWHSPMADIPGSHCQDALPGAGVHAGTWPSILPSWGRAQIDHILVNGGSVKDAGVASYAGLSDHRPVHATLRF